MRSGAWKLIRQRLNVRTTLPLKRDPICHHASHVVALTKHQVHQHLNYRRHLSQSQR